MLKSAELIVAMHGKIPQATWPSLTTSQLSLINKNINNVIICDVQSKRYYCYCHLQYTLRIIHVQSNHF